HSKQDKENASKYHRFSFSKKFELKDLTIKNTSSYEDALQYIAANSLSNKTEIQYKNFVLGHEVTHKKIQSDIDIKNHFWAGIYIKSNAEIWIRQINDLFVFQLSFKNRIKENLEFYAHCGKSHRFPSIYERFEPCYGNKDLKPEINHGCLIGL